MTKKTLIISIIIIFVIIFALVIDNYNLDGTKQLIVIDNTNNKVDNIIVLPLSSKSLGIGFGPEGKGFHFKNKYVVTKPFIFNSGDDFIGKIRRVDGVFIPPFLYIGYNNYINNWLLLKKGFEPKLVKRFDVYSDYPIVMINNNYNYSKITEMLLASNYNQNMLRHEFDVETTKEIYVALDKKDIELITNYMK